jgi:hypothetical protein
MGKSESLKSLLGKNSSHDYPHHGAHKHWQKFSLQDLPSLGQPHIVLQATTARVSSIGCTVPSHLILKSQKAFAFESRLTRPEHAFLDVFSIRHPRKNKIRSDRGQQKQQKDSHPK